MGQGSLTIVGTGIRCGFQTTIEARYAIKAAERVFFLVTDPSSAQWIHELNSTAESLADCYRVNQPRIDAYREMQQRVLEVVRAGYKVCVAFYGHPGIFVRPSHALIRRATEEGYAAKLQPGISAEDCLFVDLGFDPAQAGCQSFEATDFLINQRRFDSRSALILWQVGVIGQDVVPVREHQLGACLDILAEALKAHYGDDHEIVIYEAADLPIGGPRITKLRLSNLPGARTGMSSTLFVPPLPSGEPAADILRRLRRK